MFRHLIILLLLVSVLISGCYNKVEVDDTIVALGRGLDIEGNAVVYSVQLALPQPREGTPSGPKFLVVSEKDKSYAVAARKLTLKFPRKPLWAMANTVIISEALAKKDVALFTDFILRNRNVHPYIFMFLATKATPEEVLEVKVPLEEYSALALEKMIQRQQRQIGIYMPVKGKDFTSKLATEGIEPVLPQVTIEQKDKEKIIKLDGTAVFRGRRMVGSLNEQESRGLRYLSPKRNSGGLFFIKSPTKKTGLVENTITLELISLQSKAKPVIKDNKIKILIEVEADGNFYEQNNTQNYLTPDMIKKLEQAANETIKQDIQSSISRAQSFKSDIFGWGLAIARSNPDKWEDLKESWPEHFARIESDIKVDFKLRRSYLLIDSFEIK